YGSSPRGGQALILGAKVLALLDGRPHVAADDVERVAPAAFRHRLVLNFTAGAAGTDAEQIVARVLASARRLQPCGGRPMRRRCRRFAASCSASGARWA